MIINLESMEYVVKKIFYNVKYMKVQEGNISVSTKEVIINVIPVYLPYPYGTGIFTGIQM